MFCGFLRFFAGFLVVLEGVLWFSKAFVLWFSSGFNRFCELREVLGGSS